MKKGLDYIFLMAAFLCLVACVLFLLAESAIAGGLCLIAASFNFLAFVAWHKTNEKDEQ